MKTVKRAVTAGCYTGCCRQCIRTHTSPRAADQAQEAMRLPDTALRRTMRHVAGAYEEVMRLPDTVPGRPMCHVAGAYEEVMRLPGTVPGRIMCHVANVYEEVMRLPGMIHGRCSFVAQPLLLQRNLPGNSLLIPCDVAGAAPEVMRLPGARLLILRNTAALAVDRRCHEGEMSF
ncbi:hypothetical protein HF329_21395 [Chitinophaga oryzae]|uniref:Uncharacterized protein n=1 Tax=Chitinophaga oryzae TaxID=2725414 RepID=A0AAE6ZID6_9BACT|nr:hypothetical protein [Chitinophaga oryzae]QJB33729.1 hypothetical protein HF329_21395 [Chitinophaga oryzae]